MKNTKYTSIACIVTMSFVLSLSLAYSAERLRTITPQQTVVPAQQTPPKEFKQIRKLNPMFKITSPKTTDVLYFDKTYPITWDRFGETGQKVAFQFIMASDPSKDYHLLAGAPNTGSFMLPIGKFGHWSKWSGNPATVKTCHPSFDPLCSFVQEEDPNKEYIIRIYTQPCSEGWICKDEVKVKIMNQ